MWVAFANFKSYSRFFFSAKMFAYMPYLMIKSFNNTLTKDMVSFEQLGPELLTKQLDKQSAPSTPSEVITKRDKMEQSQKKAPNRMNKINKVIQGINNIRIELFGSHIGFLHNRYTVTEKQLNHCNETKMRLIDKKIYTSNQSKKPLVDSWKSKPNTISGTLPLS